MTCMSFLFLEKPGFNEVLGIKNDILKPGQSYSKMYGQILGITKSPI